ncbi:MAG: serine protease [Candidatus Sulfotelmatobacter sp.]
MQNYFLLIDLFAGSALGRQGPIPRPYAFPRRSEGLHARRLWPVLLLFALALPVCAQEFVPEHVVFPITDFKPDIKHLAPISMKFGTGFCLDPDCRFVGTNYHVAKVMGKYVRIKGVFSAHRYLDSDPDDAGAEDMNLGWGGSLKYTPAHDLAIYEMRHPVKNFHGIGFDGNDLENGAEVDIYAYPFNWNPKRGLVHWHGKFIGETQQGLLAFSYEEGRVRGGASGGIVVDSNTKKIVGILNEIGEGKDRIALAVPVKELSGFVTRAQPYLQATLFPKTVFVSPVAADLYPRYVWARAEGLSQRPAEPPEVVKLRRAAQHLADSMRHFTATETFAWGRDNPEPEVTDAYETLILDGAQRWRRQGNKKFYDNVPFPPLNGSIVSGDQWSALPRMVGTELNLKIHQAPDAIVGGRTVHVFQYAANVEDSVCLFRSVMSYGFFQRSTTKFYDCHGEVWTDESGIILRISQALDLSGPWYRWWGVMTYGWLEKDGTQYLVPVTITTQAEHNQTYWCRGLFTDYEMFGVKTRLVLPTEPERTQKSSLGAP